MVVCVCLCVCCVYGVVLLVGVVGSVQVPGMIVLSYLSRTLQVQVQVVSLVKSGTFTSVVRV